jgi:glycosyltransferase involved in cell wall biosynthesis
VTAGVRVVAGLSAEEYDAEIANADIVLVPNRCEYYRHALSGVFTDALALGKPVIVAEGTYMAKELGRHGSGATFRSGSATALAETMRQTARRLGELRHKAAQGRVAWLEIHNPKTYVDTLLQFGAGSFQ